MIIAVEGIDQAGKHTQSRMLRDMLEGEGMKVELFSFPDYSTPSGARIREQLNGGGELRKEEIHGLLAENRAEKLGRINGLPPDTILIMDRYTPSNMAYGLANGLDREFLEYVDRRMPKPDLVILIDIDPQTARGRKGTDRDRFESRTGFLGAVRSNYLDLARGGAWRVVDGCGEPGAVHGEIAAEVRRAVAPRAGP